MKFQGTSVTINYEKIDGMKKAYYNNEHILKEFFNEATVLPVPDEAPLDIPRIIIKTLGEHAQLTITPVASTFEVRYDGDYERNWRLCSEYIMKRMEKVFEFLNLFTGNSYKYIGLVTNVLCDEIKSDGAVKISEVLLNTNNIKDIYDLNIRYTFVEDKKLFVNIMLQNARMFKNDINVNIPGSLCESDQIAESIGVVVDINDRYGFNNNRDYKSSSSMLKNLSDCMTNVMNGKLQDLIYNGVY
ncbi:MAG: hypothetical protein BWY02_01798 [bacterium ADurb.Bin157]|nr:MAG: hypothetical protein BWY02_01798 [bacterium ADurb.Bin157]